MKCGLFWPCDIRLRRDETTKWFRWVHGLPLSGGHSEGATPVPIPNTVVKPLSPDGTAWVTAWESRKLPE